MKSKFAVALSVLALGALAIFPAASPASGLSGIEVVNTAEGPKFSASKYPAMVTGERADTPPFSAAMTVLDTGSYSLDCNDATFSGSGALMVGDRKSLVFNTAFEGCHVNGPNGIGVAVNTNGCRYSYELSGELATNEYGTNASITCASKPIEMSFSGCTVKIPGQSLEGSTAFGNIVLGGAAIVGGFSTPEGVDYETSGYLCQFAGTPAGVYTDGTAEMGSLLPAEF